MADVFEIVRQVTARTDAAVLVMTYWNPVLRYGIRRFAEELKAAGGAGLITPDLVPDEADEWIAVADELGLAKIFLVAPSSTPARVAATTANCSGFVYAASVMGVTGARTSVGDAAKGLVERTKAATDLPVCVGLGVSTAEQAREIGRYADGVIVGSALFGLIGGFLAVPTAAMIAPPGTPGAATIMMPSSRRKPRICAGATSICPM